MASIMDITPAAPRRKLSRRTVLLGGAVAALGVAAVPVALAWPKPDPPVPPPTPTVVANHLLNLVGQQFHAMAFSPDGRMLATASSTRVDLGEGPARVQLWDAATGGSLGAWDEVDMLGTLAFSPDGNYLASVEDRLCLRDVATGKFIAELSRSSPADVVFSPDGALLAATDGDGINVYDAATRKPLTRLPADRAFDLAFNHDRTRLAAVIYLGSVLVWDTGTWQQIMDLSEPRADSVTFIGESGLLAVHRATWESQQDVVAFRDSTTGEETAWVAVGDYLTDTGFSRDGTVMAASNGRGVRLWDVPHARPIKELASGDYGDVCWSPSDTTIAVAFPGATLDDFAGVSLWNLSWSG